MSGEAHLSRSEMGLPEIVSGQGDNLVTLYHGTNKEGYDQILRDGVITSGWYFGGVSGVSLTPRRDIAEEYGEEVIEVEIPMSYLVVDRESYDDNDVETAIDRGVSVYALSDVRICNHG